MAQRPRVLPAHTTGPLLANTDEQAVVADMLRMRAQEKTDNWIATYLNQNAVPGKGGGVGGWQANTVANVLGRVTDEIGADGDVT